MCSGCPEAACAASQSCSSMTWQRMVCPDTLEAISGQLDESRRRRRRDGRRPVIRAFGGEDDSGGLRFVFASRPRHWSVAGDPP